MQTESEFLDETLSDHLAGRPLDRDQQSVLDQAIEHGTVRCRVRGGLERADRHPADFRVVVRTAADATAARRSLADVSSADNGPSMAVDVVVDPDTEPDDWWDAAVYNTFMQRWIHAEDASDPAAMATLRWVAANIRPADVDAPVDDLEWVLPSDLRPGDHVDLTSVPALAITSGAEFEYGEVEAAEVESDRVVGLYTFGGSAGVPADRKVARVRTRGDDRPDPRGFEALPADADTFHCDRCGRTHADGHCPEDAATGDDLGPDGDGTAAGASRWADAFAAYEYRQVAIAVRQGDLPEDALERCDRAGWLLDSLAQHPEDALVDTCRASGDGVDATTVREAFVAVYEARLADEPDDEDDGASLGDLLVELADDVAADPALGAVRRFSLHASPYREPGGLYLEAQLVDAAVAEDTEWWDDLEGRLDEALWSFPAWVEIKRRHLDWLYDEDEQVEVDVDAARPARGDASGRATEPLSGKDRAAAAKAVSRALGAALPTGYNVVDHGPGVLDDPDQRQLAAAAVAAAASRTPDGVVVAAIVSATLGPDVAVDADDPRTVVVSGTDEQGRAWTVDASYPDGLPGTIRAVKVGEQGGAVSVDRLWSPDPGKVADRIVAAARVVADGVPADLWGYDLDAKVAP